MEYGQYLLLLKNVYYYGGTITKLYAARPVLCWSLKQQITYYYCMLLG